MANNDQSAEIAELMKCMETYVEHLKGHFSVDIRVSILVRTPDISGSVFFGDMDVAEVVETAQYLEPFENGERRLDS